MFRDIGERGKQNTKSQMPKIENLPMPILTCRRPIAPIMPLSSILGLSAVVQYSATYRAVAPTPRTAFGGTVGYPLHPAALRLCAFIN